MRLPWMPYMAAVDMCWNEVNDWQGGEQLLRNRSSCFFFILCVMQLTCDAPFCLV